MNYLRLFARLFLRPLLKEPVRTALTVFAVALGVAVVLAIELAGEAAAGSFRSSIETLAGDADFEVTAIGGVPDKVFAALATLPYPIHVRPRIEDSAVVGDSGETVPLIGVDMVADALQSTGDSADQDALNRPDAVWLSPNLGRKRGDSIRLALNDRVRTYTVSGILEQHQRPPEQANVVIMDIAVAMRELNKHGRLDRILVNLPQTRSLADWEQLLRQNLPDYVSLQRQGSHTNENRRMLQAFRWNLRVLSYIALVVGAFLIYNTIAVSVVRRRNEIGVLRALGATRGAILGAFVAESACFGVAGATLGILLGRLMAVGAVRLISGTVEALYVSSRPAPIVLTPALVIEAITIGLGVAILSAYSPAREAASLSAADAMARGRAEYEIRLRKMRDLVLGAGLALLALCASRLPAIGSKPIFGYVSALLLIGACALSIPAMTAAMTSALANAAGHVFGVEALLACRSLGASLRRTSVLVGALSTAIAMIVSVGIMVGSFRQTVLIWMQDQLEADFYLRPAGPAAADRHPIMAPEVADRLSALPGLAALGWLRSYAISFQGLPATLAGVDARVAARYGHRVFLSGADDRRIFEQLPSGDYVIVSEPFANKHGVRPGKVITLPLGDQSRSFRVLGVYYDYSDERGYVMMDRSVLLKYLPDPAPSSLAIYLEPGANPAQARRAIDRLCAGRNISVFSNRTLQREAIRVFDRTFAITYALEAIAVIVAAMSIAGALLALVIDRRREVGLIRFLGGSGLQVRRMILFEAGFLGLMANLAGVVLGVVLSLILIFVINKQSFGWTIQFHLPVAILVAGLSLVYLATVSAGLYPARVAVRLRPIEVVHEE